MGWIRETKRSMTSVRSCAIKGKEVLDSLDGIEGLLLRCSRATVPAFQIGILTSLHYQSLRRSTNDEIHASERGLFDAIGRIDSPSETFRAYFTAASEIADDSKELAKRLIDAAEEMRATQEMLSPRAAKAHSYCSDLAARAFSALLRDGSATNDDLADLARLIEKSQALSSQLFIWAETVLRGP